MDLSTANEVELPIVNSGENLLPVSLMMATTASAMGFSKVSVLHNGVHRTSNPWDTINLSKSERKNKSYEELQELRKKKYEESKE